jgi:alpha-galactosidase
MIRNDIGPGWTNVYRIINQIIPITSFAGPGGWNDMDMLEVGNGQLTIAEQQTHVCY